jgi:hypothetical protein
MSQIVNGILTEQKDRIIKLVALATNQHATERGTWTWKPQEDPKLATLEASLNDPNHDLFGNFDVLTGVRALYALEGKNVPDIRETSDIPLIVLGYGVALVPTTPVLGGIPVEYDAEKTKNAYTIGSPVLCVSTWRKSENANQRGRGVATAKVALGDLPFLPRRADLTRPATDEEITALVDGLIEERGVAFVTDVLKNLEDAYAHLV